MLLPGIELVYLFGSFADGSATAASDVDVAFLSSEKIDALVRYTAAQKLANQLNRNVDLVDLFSAGAEISREAAGKGRLIFGDRDQADEFEVRVMRDYQDYRYCMNDQIEALVKP